ncbi:PucR family transcriptional regulator [Sediminivirga luteola]|uniref:PucR family transcriptional regulator n=1 Tax=Sediminivirga luteola TaxID=1774748 RepID=UPI001F56FAEF|nr:PucR family transcriptional regulator ligand-binding domain-containing protein [Sediminivirga luteola]
MPVTLQALLAERRFRLRLATPAEELPDEALSAPISWVHSSDLEDPTPFLDAGHLLLTDGTQFPVEQTAPEFYEQYAQRLVDRGIRGLGFATQVVHGHLPDAVRQACRRMRLPLFEVPERIPFIAIIQHVAEANAAEQNARMSWLLTAQRAIARAARRPDSLPAILGELERQLDSWVALFDAAGEPVHLPNLRSAPARSLPALRREVQASLARDVQGLWRIENEELAVTFQTIGRRGSMRGVLAIGRGDPLDIASNELVGSVIGFASVALDHHRSLDAARGSLRSAVLELLLQGSPEAAARVARPVWGSLPGDTVHLVSALSAVPPEGESHRPRHPVRGLEGLVMPGASARRRFHAVLDGEVVVVCVPDELPQVLDLLRRHEVVAGISGPVPAQHCAQALREARRAREWAAQHGRESAFIDEFARAGVLGMIPDADARLFAGRLLSPLRETGRKDGAELLETARVWLKHECAWNAAAAELGLHRHSLRNRIDALGRLLELDLGTIAGRFQLWAALQAADEE